MRIDVNRRYWDFPLGPVFGVAGTITTISVRPQCLFRVEKVMVTDTGDPPGSATMIMQFIVGSRVQRPVTGGASLAAFFGPEALGNGVSWSADSGGLRIQLQVSFVQDATFRGSLFGSAEV